MPAGTLTTPANRLQVVSRKVPTMSRINYARPFEPPTRPAFLALPPGAIQPAGWLRDWCLAARDGYTGHMDDVDPEFQRAWAVDHRMTGERLNWPQGAWPYEGGGYWFDGLVRLGYALGDEELLAQARRRFGVVVDHLHSNTILFLWWLDRSLPADVAMTGAGQGWSMWACGLLGRAMVGYLAGSQDPRVRQALERAYGGHREFLWQGWGMSNPWPAFDTWTQTGNAEIAAALTALFEDEQVAAGAGSGSWQRYSRRPDDAPGAETNDHVVHFLESTTPWALGYLWTGRAEFLEAALAWHDLLARESMQPSGVPVADEYYGPTGAFRGTETCDVAGYLWSQMALVGVCGQGRLADRAERAFFNAGPATVARDFRTHVYFQCPNRVVDHSPPHPHGPKASGNSYQPKHHPLCCTAALNRIVPGYVTNLWMATYDNGLAAVAYGPCRVSAMVADQVPVALDCRTDYPFDETLEITVTPAREATFPLSFRIPGWCERPSLTVNGEALDPTPDANGFVRLERCWRPGDVVALIFPMAATVLTGEDRNADGAPYAAVAYGPLLFALPISDCDPNTPDPAAPWRYALDPDRLRLTIERGAMPARWDWPLAAPLTLRTEAVPIAWDPDPAAPRLPAAPVAVGSPEPITLIPYGCTKFRIAMFPVAGRGDGG